jgi:RNA polymerase sigma-70 factor, ECF subfamily
MTDEIPVVAPGSAASEDVLHRALSGDDAAFVSLYLELQPRLRRYAVSLVGQDADDVTAEAWLQIVRDLDSFTGDLDAFRAWSARIVRNRAFDDARARSRRPAERLSEADLATFAAPDDTAAEAVDQIRTEAAVRLIAGLPREQAEVVLLRAVVGLDARATASVMGKTPGAVRVAAHRGLKTLRRQLEATRKGRAAS